MGRTGIASGLRLSEGIVLVSACLSARRATSATIVGVIPDPIDVGDDILDAVDWNAVLSLWLQPLATVIAGLLAIGAAAIAYVAVTRQIKANTENVRKQISAAAAEQQKNRAADWAKMRRQEVLDLVLEAGNIARG